MSKLSGLTLYIALFSCLRDSTKIYSELIFFITVHYTYFFLLSDWSKLFGAETLLSLPYVTSFTIKAVNIAHLSRRLSIATGSPRAPLHNQSSRTLGVLNQFEDGHQQTSGLPACSMVSDC